MTGGFGAIPDELRQTASTIGDVIGGVADLVWRGPGGDYGHPGVQQGWAQFIEDMRGKVEKLHATANEHGENLKKAAIEYVQGDEDVETKLAHIGDAFHDLGTPIGGGLGGIVPSVAVGPDDGGMVGGGWAGPLKDRGVDLGGVDDGGMVGGGIAGPLKDRGVDLGGGVDDDGMVGGGWAGPLKDRGVDLGSDAVAESGIMSPERSRELFPPGDIGSRLNPPDTEGPVY